MWISGDQSKIARAGVSASETSRNATAQSPVAWVTKVTGRGSRSPVYQRQARWIAGRQSATSVASLSQEMIR